MGKLRAIKQRKINMKRRTQVRKAGLKYSTTIQEIGTELPHNVYTS